VNLFNTSVSYPFNKPVRSFVLVPTVSFHSTIIDASIHHISRRDDVGNQVNDGIHSACSTSILNEMRLLIGIGCGAGDRVGTLKARLTKHVKSLYWNRLPVEYILVTAVLALRAESNDEFVIHSPEYSISLRDNFQPCKLVFIRLAFGKAIDRPRRRRSDGTPIESISTDRRGTNTPKWDGMATKIPRQVKGVNILLSS
jgi:hypothetical protein